MFTAAASVGVILLSVLNELCPQIDVKAQVVRLLYYLRLLFLSRNMLPS
jgi:hypothetical protein